MYFAIKEQKAFYKYMEMWENVNNMIKKIIVNLYIQQKYLIAKNHSSQKKAFNVLQKSNNSAYDIY